MTRARSCDKEQRTEALNIVGADANNLKHIDVRIPLDRVTAVTGVSGSGKSSLLADTLATEANRRMQVFLGIHQPHLEGAPPRAFIGPMPASIHVGQRAFRASSRTTVGTATGFLTTLRRLFVACARPYSDELGRFVPAPSPSSYAAWLVKQYRGRAVISAVPAYFVATDGVRYAEHLRELGITDVIVRSETDSPKAWERGHKASVIKWKPLRHTIKHIIEANIGTVEVSPKADRKKIEALLQRAFDAGHGQAFIDLPDAMQPELRGPFGPRLDSVLHYVDPDLSTCFFRPNVHLLSFNAPEHSESGACKTCRGLGRATTLDENALVVHPERSLHQGAFSLWTEKNYRYVNIQHETIEGLRGMRGFSPDVPWNKLPEDARRLILDGSGGALVTDKDRNTGRKMSAPRSFEGFRHAVLERVARGTKVSESLAFLVSEGPCPDCGGTRWSYQARALRIDGVGIHHLLAKPFGDLITFTEENGSFATAVPADAATLVRVLHHHAASFVSVGLGHLTGDRGMLEVSEGEGRRARLAAVLNSRHAGLCMLLDEPARGLHDEDVQNMANAIASLARVHTVVMNEHRHALVRTADHVIELGPGAGAAGGEVVYDGPVARSFWAKAPAIDRTRLPTPPRHPYLTIRGATIHNLDSVDCAIPLGRLTCITGVSGSGKSSFVRGILVPAVARALPNGVKLEDFDQRQGTWTSVEGIKHIKGLVALDQKAPPPNRRSIVATFLDVADDIRAVFGSSEQARQTGLSPSDFGLNAGSGRCQLCLGIGEVEERDEWTTCPMCGGMRFGQEALSIRIDSMSISELLDMSVTELHARAPAFLSAHLPVFAAMSDLGVGHVALGRRVDTLSGGEIQRLRIAAKLAEHEAGDLLFVLDEPAAGLHPRDVELLVRALDRILDHGRNTIVLVEHNSAIIEAADWLVEFGPGSGPHGGRIVADGSPEQVSNTDTATGRVLAGRPAPARLRLPPNRPARTQAELDDPTKQAERVKAWMRHLIGDNVAPPEEAPVAASTDRPIALLSNRFWHGRRSWEVGDLDLELAKLLLDFQVNGTNQNEIDSLVHVWGKNADARLAIYPFLRDLQIWGRHLPASVIDTARGHLRAMSLELITSDGSPLKRGGSADWLEVRAVGDRFVPCHGSAEERRRLITDALTLGGGYVELRGSCGELRGRLGPRLLDLERGIVAPMAPAPSHFSRHHRRGQCSMCKGSGQVMTLKEELVIGDRRAAPEDEAFLHAAAASVMKGVRRSELVPFLRRMAEEGLWKASTPYQRLDQAACDMLLFGCWTRPGHGTFLKSAKDDPSEVGAWLRWDGLFHALLGQLERSTDARWKEALERSRSMRACPSCEGTGLAAYSKLLLLNERSLYDWTRDGTAKDLYRALERLHAHTPRLARTQERILDCLAPLAAEARAGSLRQLADDELAREVSGRAVRTFTDMPAIFI
jgi:excinuclease ABC A subunit